MTKFTEQKKNEWIAKFKDFLRKKYHKELVTAANEDTAALIEYGVVDKYDPAFGELLSEDPETFFEITEEALNQMDLPAPVKLRITGITDIINIRDLRSKQIGKFVTTEGIVRRASEIRPEIIETIWECPVCGDHISQERKANQISRPFKCNCGNRKDFKEIDKKMIDTRWIVIEEPFELTEGERPSQLTVFLTDDLVAVGKRNITDPGSRIKVNGILRDVPKGGTGKSASVKLDFFLDCNYYEPTEIGYEKLKITEEDERIIKELAADPHIYEKLISSLAPSLYGMKEIKESVILQLFGGVPRTLKDKVKFRGEIHILMLGDPASGKSQLLKLVPQIVPRGKYVSGKGTTAAGLTATVTKDEQFMGGWVLEAGAMVLANKGLLSVDEFEKMSSEDQVAMHEALEQGSISIAKASIIATLPANTSVLAGGNPKFSRFDPYIPISKQVTIPDTLLSRFDLKFMLMDVPNAEEDKKLVDHILRSREEDSVLSVPSVEPEIIRKYIAYARQNCHPMQTKETGKLLRQFYLNTRKKFQGTSDAIPITLRQFEALMRLAEASARIRLSETVEKDDAKRAMKLMQYSLKQLGYDPHTGQIDVDRSEGATGASERSNIRIVLDIVDALSEKKKEMPLSEIIELAKKEGVDNADEIIEKLRREGMLFEPNPGFIQKV